MNDRISLVAMVNGETVEATVAPLESLAETLRRLGFASVRIGCDEGVCGSCSVTLDGRTIRSCLTLAAQMQGARLETVENFDADSLHATIQEAFVTHFAAQCGFCTSGMLAVAAEYLRDESVPDHADDTSIRKRLNAVICRCTGYQQIVAAVRAVALHRQEVRRAG